MYLKRLATNLFMEQIRGLHDYNAVESALSEILFGGKDCFDLRSAVDQFSKEKGAIAEKVSSWLGDGDNQPISGREIEQTLGEKTVGALASRLKVNQAEVKSGLSAMLPKLIDAASRGGSLFYTARTNEKNNPSSLFQAVSGLLK